jgi:hypothetical protein
MLRRIFTQVAILVSIASLTAILLNHFGINIFASFFVGIVIQFLAYYTFIITLNTYVALKNKELDNERLKELSYQGLGVTCPCYKQINDFIPVRLNTPTYYRCSGCSKAISVLINTETAVVTEPQDSSIQHMNAILGKGIQNANS